MPEAWGLRPEGLGRPISCFRWRLQCAPSLYFCLRLWRDNSLLVGLFNRLGAFISPTPNLISSSRPGGSLDKLSFSYSFGRPGCYYWAHHPTTWQFPRYTKVLRYQAMCLGILKSVGFSPIIKPSSWKSVADVPHSEIKEPDPLHKSCLTRCLSHWSEGSAIGAALGCRGPRLTFVLPFVQNHYSGTYSNGIS